jgi:sugar-specific transcriptional regulator TrmB
LFIYLKGRAEALVIVKALFGALYMGLGLPIEQEALVERLRKALDLTLYEAKLYIAMLQGASDPKEASVMSGVPLPRIYDVVKVLESKGMVYKDPNGWYRAVSPRALAAASIARLEEDSRRRAREIAELAEALERLGSKQRTPRYVIVKGAYNIVSAAVDFFKASAVAYITVSTVMARDGLGEEIIKALLSYIGDLRVLLVEGALVERISETGIPVKVTQLPLLDSISSRVGLMVIVNEPFGEPLAVAVEDQAQAEPYFRRLSSLWTSISGGPQGNT